MRNALLWAFTARYEHRILAATFRPQEHPRRSDRVRFGQIPIGFPGPRDRPTFATRTPPDHPLISPYVTLTRVIRPKARRDRTRRRPERSFRTKAAPSD